MYDEVGLTGVEVDGVAGLEAGLNLDIYASISQMCLTKYSLINLS